MRLTIPDLAIGKAYQAQVRAKSGTEVGQWSPILDIPAVYETTTPADLSGGNISVTVGTGNSGDTFIATWTYTQPKDFDHYEYRWYGSSDNSTYVRSIIFSTTTPSATLTFSENTSLFGEPKSYMKIEVRAVNTSGLTSPNWVVSSTPVQQLAPSIPTGFTAVAGPDVIKLEWLAPVPDLQNIEYYKIEVSVDGAAYIEAAKVKYPTLKYSYDTTYYDKRHDFRISSINKFGRASSTLALTGGPVKVSAPSVMNGLISNIVSYSRTAGSPVVTYVTKDPHGLSSTSKIYVHGTRSKAFSVTSITGSGQLTATTSAAHGFSTGNAFEIVGSSNDIFNERGIINAVTTNTFSYASSSSGTFVSPATAYVVDGTSTVDTVFGEPVVPTIISTTSISCSPNSGTGAISVVSQTYAVTNASGTGGVATYTYTGSPSILPGQRVTVQDVNPDQYNLTDALVISTPTSSTFTIESQADGAYVAAGTVISRPFGDIYPSDNAVRIKDDGITIGNMGTGFIVGISPTSFNMQSSGSSTRLALSSSHIDMYKNGDKTVQFDGNTGDATIVGKFSTGFSPNARVELDSGSAVPESIKFYSGDFWENNSGSIASDYYQGTYTTNSIAKVSSLSNNTYIPAIAYTISTSQNVPSIPPTTFYGYIRTSPAFNAYDFPNSGYLDISTNLGVRTIYYSSVSTPITTDTTSDLTLPLSSATINVTSTLSYESNGQLSVGGVLVTYTGKTASTFTGCSASGTGTITSGSSVDGQSRFTVGGINEAWTTVPNSPIGVRLYVVTSTTANAFPLDALKDSVDPGSIYKLSIPGIYSGNQYFSYIGVQKSSTTAMSISTIGTLTGGTRTATLASAHTFKINDQVTIASVTPTQINGTYYVTAVPSSTSFTYATSISNAYTSGGNVVLSPSIKGISLSSGSSSNGGTAATSDEIKVTPASNAITISAPTITDYAQVPYTGSSAVFTGGAVYNGYVIDINDTINFTANKLFKNNISPIKSSVGGVLSSSSTTALTYVTHNLGVTPSSVVASVRSNSTGASHSHVYTGNFTSTTFSLYTTFTNSSGITTQSSAATSWIAVE